MPAKYYAYRSHGDEAGTYQRTMRTDPNTGDVPNLHAAGDVIIFDSEEERDAYVARKVVKTTLEDGSHRRFHWVTAITTEEAEKYLAACAAVGMCIHKGYALQGLVRVPA